MKSKLDCFYKMLFFSSLFAFFSFSFSPEMQKIFQARISMYFCDSKCDMEVYVITDWMDPDSKQLEQSIEGMSPELVKKARLYFIDIFPSKTQNLTQANLSFLINAQKNRDEYFKLRNTLFSLALKNANPTADEINAAIAAAGIKNNSLPQDVLDAGLKFFQSINKNMNITKSPTILIYNDRTHEMKKIEGLSEISQEKIMALMELLKTPPPKETRDI